LAAADPNLQYLATQGILLTNYYAVTHPSEPNYCAVVAGDNFGMDNDDFNEIPANISTIVDVLDTKGIAWGEYQEAMPYAGFQGFNYSNQQTFANDYVRKHDPLILFDSVTKNATRLSLIKNFTSFYSDLSAQTLPQWSFITPNMTNDGHDTNVTFTANWSRSFLDPLLNNTYFMNNTLIVLTFDEDETYTVGNKVFTLLLGGVIPASLKGTTDSTFYNHYSMLSTVEVNWGLPSLGRWDCGANVLELVANKTGYVNSAVNTTHLYFNSSYPGAVSDAKFYPVWPVPDTLSQCASGKGVLGSIVSTWGKSTGTYNYTNVYNYDAASGNNVGGSPVQAVFVTASSSSVSPSGTGSSGGGSSSSTGSSTGASASPTGSASFVKVGTTAVLGISAMVVAMLL
jgi:acid phosphatase